MEGVVVFAYENCPGYQALFHFLDNNNIQYTYIDIYNTTPNNLAAFDWFNVGLVPYVGINGDYFLGPVAEAMFKVEGIIE